jgi:nitroreductase
MLVEHEGKHLRVALRRELAAAARRPRRGGQAVPGEADGLTQYRPSMDGIDAAKAARLRVRPARVPAPFRRRDARTFAGLSRVDAQAPHRATLLVGARPVGAPGERDLNGGNGALRRPPAPWTFVVVSDSELKRQIRAAAEEEERISYEGRMPSDWLEALRPLGTDWRKPHLEQAPHLVVVFEQAYGLRPDGTKAKHYYVRESVGIAVGLLLASLHQAGLVTLTHTPSPMGFLRELLGRPENERAYVVVPVGYPAPGAEVPDLTRKPLEEILVRS